MLFYIHVRETCCKNPFGPKLNTTELQQFEVKRPEVAASYCKAVNTWITII
jgi:hypothetical protein